MASISLLKHVNFFVAHFDHELAVIRDILSGLENAIKSTENQMSQLSPNEDEDYRSYVYQYSNDLLDSLCGTAFVVCQTFISSVVSEVISINAEIEKAGGKTNVINVKSNKTKETRIATMEFNNSKVNPKVGNKYTQVQSIDSLANCYKHRDEPPLRPETQDVLNDIPSMGSMLSELQNGVQCLGQQGNYNLLALAEILALWANELAEALQDDLNTQGLLAF